MVAMQKMMAEMAAELRRTKEAQSPTQTGAPRPQKEPLTTERASVNPPAGPSAGQHTGG